MGRKESKDKKERDFIEEESSTLACPIGAYVYCCPQTRVFQQGTLGNGMSDVW